MSGRDAEAGLSSSRNSNMSDDEVAEMELYESVEADVAESADVADVQVGGGCVKGCNVDTAAFRASSLRAIRVQR